MRSSVQKWSGVTVRKCATRAWVPCPEFCSSIRFPVGLWYRRKGNCFWIRYAPLTAAAGTHPFRRFIRKLSRKR